MLVVHASTLNKTYLFIYLFISGWNTTVSVSFFLILYVRNSTLVYTKLFLYKLKTLFVVKFRSQLVITVNY